MTSKQPPSYAPKNSKARPRVGKARAVDTDTSFTPQNAVPQTQIYEKARPNLASAQSNLSPNAYSNVDAADPQAPKTSAQKRKRSIRPVKIIVWLIVLFLIASIAWVIYLYMYGNSKLEHTEALSGRANTPGETYLIVGSDKREDGVLEDGAAGERADTIMILQVPDDGHAALISLPRDTLVDIPGFGLSKINAAYSRGGASLLVETVENLTGLTVDHYIEVSMGGVRNLVNAVDGVNLCYDEDVSDAYSGMEWSAGCHDVNGEQALAFSRMRYSDPRGDIGRTDRQRQVVSKIIDKAVSSSTVVRPWRQRALVGAAADNLTTDPDTSLLGLARAGFGLRSAMGEGGLMGTPPISNMGYWYAGQSCVQLDPDKIDDFWTKLEHGELTSEDLNQPLG